MHSIVDASYVEDYVLHLKFSDGFESDYDFKPFLWGEVGLPLLDLARFQEFFVDDSGALNWPNGLDACPNFLRELTPA